MKILALYNDDGFRYRFYAASDGRVHTQQLKNCYWRARADLTFRSIVAARRAVKREIRALRQSLMSRV